MKSIERIGWAALQIYVLSANCKKSHNYAEYLLATLYIYMSQHINLIYVYLILSGSGKYCHLSFSAVVSTANYFVIIVM